MAGGFYRSKDPTNSKVLKEKAAKENNTKNIKKTEITHAKNSIQITVTQINTASPLVYNDGVTRGQLPQRAGSLGLNGGGLPPRYPQCSIGRYCL